MKLNHLRLLLLSFFILGLLYTLAPDTRPTKIQAAPPVQDDEFPTSPGDYVRRVMVDGRERLYLVHIPPSYVADESYPLLVSLHEYGENPVSHADQTQFSLYANQEDFIVAYPAGTGDPLAWYTLADMPDGAPDNTKFIEMMVQDIKDNLSIDEARIFLAGFSNGGGMAHRIACDVPDLFASIAIVSGWHTIDQPCEPATPTSILAIHGKFDEVIPYLGDETAENIPNWAETWAVRNQCDVDNPTGSGPQDSIKTVEWSNCAHNTNVTLITIEQGRHEWSSGLSAVLLAYFKDHTFLDRTDTIPSHTDLAYQIGTNSGVVYSMGTVREFALYIPTSYSSNQSHPLVISLHGYSSSPRQNMHTTELSDKADEAGFIVVYPRGREDTTNGLLGWYSRPSPYIGFSDDITFISDLITHLGEHLAIDATRVYATGLSNGGGMTHRLGCDLADRIAAIAPVAGAYSLGDDCEPARPMPVLAIHGQRDTIVSYNGIPGASEPIPVWTQGWATRNGCAPESTATTPEEGLTVDTWDNCTGDSIVHLYSYATLGHRWHGDATDIIWDFFSQYELSQ